MTDPPPFVVFAHRVFNIAVGLACLFGLVYVWKPITNETLQRVFWSVLVLLFGSMLLLAGHRTVYWRSDRSG